MTSSLPTSRVLRLGLSWLLVALAGSAALARTGGPTPEPFWFVVTVALWSGVAASGVRTGLLLTAARAGFIRVRRDAPPHLLWRLVPVPALLGFGLGAGVAWLALEPARAPMVNWALALVGVTLLALIIGRLLGRRDTAAPRSARRTTWVRWCVVGTAIPAALIAAALGALIAAQRFAGLDVVPAGELSRHLAVTLWSYGLLLGIAGAMKTGREKRAGLVDVELPGFDAPPPLHIGATLGVAALWLGPVLLPPLPVATVIGLKAALGLGAGFVIGLLGALRGARTAERNR